MKLWTLLLALGLGACDDAEDTLPAIDSGDLAIVDATPADAAPGDAAPVDAAGVDAAPGDAASVDAAPRDATTPDEGLSDDAGPIVDAAPLVDAEPPADRGVEIDAMPMPDAALPPVGPSDEFADPSVDLQANPGRWQVLHPDRAAAVRIEDGHLNIIASNPPNGGRWSWFEDRYGVLVHRPVTGNFVATARLRVVDEPNAEQPPTGAFNAGGFVIRDPAGTHQNDENWVMYNFGAQGPTGYSREIKKTVNSRSGLYLNPQPFEEAVLMVCRVGDAFRFWRWQDAAWQPERFMPGVTDNQARAWPEIDETGAQPMQFDMPGLPQTLQMGLMTGAWETAGANDMSRTQSFFDYVRVAPMAPQQFADCPAAFPNP